MAKEKIKLSVDKMKNPPDLAKFSVSCRYKSPHESQALRDVRGVQQRTNVAILACPLTILW